MSAFTTANRTGFAEGAVNVDVDASLLVQLGLFVVLLFVLKPLLFDPMMRLFDERENRIERTIQKGRQLDDQSAKALAKYEAICSKARAEGATERDAIRAEGAKREAELLGRVRAETAATVEQGRAAIQRDAGAARAKLDADVAQLARAMASRVLGREVTS